MNHDTKFVTNTFSNENQWKTAIWSLALSLLVLLITFFDTLAYMVSTWWRVGTFAHGFLVLPIVSYLIWEKRQTLSLMSPKPQRLLLFFVALLLLIWLSAYVLNIVVLMQFSLVAVIVSLVWMNFGDKITAALAFPLGYLFFAVPFGGFLIPTLQDFTALFAVKALQLSSIPVYLEGRYFYIPSGSFKVEEGCSGLRYLIATICLGTLYAYLFYSSYKRRIIFILFCIIVPILANAVRAYGIVMIAHLSNYKLAVGVDHIIYGWIFFGVVITFMFWVGSYFRDIDDAPEEIQQLNNKKISKPTDYIPLTLTAVLMIVTSSILATEVYSAADEKRLINLEFPKSPTGWEGPLEAESDWSPIFQGTNYEQEMRYKSSSNDFDVYIGYYLHQKQGAELINSQNRLYDDSWKRIAEDSVSIKLREFGEWKINEVNINSNNGNRIVWYWYTVGGHFTANTITAKLLELPSRMLGKKNGAAIFAVSTKYELDPDIARLELKLFLDIMLLPLMETVNQQNIEKY